MSLPESLCGICQKGELKPFLAFGTPQRSDPISHLWRCVECGVLADRLSLDLFESAKESFDKFQSSAVQCVYGKNFDLNSTARQIEEREDMADWLANLLPINHREVCVDFGCGSGLLACALFKKFNTVIASDLDMSLAMEISKFVNIDLEFKELQNIPSNSVDLVVAWHVVEHLSTPYDFFSQCHYLLTKGGVIAIQVPLPYPPYFENDHLWFLTIESVEWIKRYFHFKNMKYILDVKNQFITYIFEK